MREILFRGKRLDNGEWVEGNLIGNELILPKGQVVYKTADNRIVTHEVNCYAIDTATVGQYTGLTDKNGKRIFEGDVVQICSNSIFSMVGVVEYHDSGFEIRDEENDMYECLWYEDTEMEVLYNIHDGPELVEGGEG